MLLLLHTTAMVNVNQIFTLVDYEPLGTKAKRWVYAQDNPEETFLIKYPRPGTGELWSEYIAYRLCVLLGIPTAKYEMIQPKIQGEDKIEWAVISPNLTPKKSSNDYGK